MASPWARTQRKPRRNGSPRADLWFAARGRTACVIAVHLDVRPYRLPLKAPLSSPAGPITERRGLVVVLTARHRADQGRRRLGREAGAGVAGLPHSGEAEEDSASPSRVATRGDSTSPSRAAAGGGSTSAAERSPDDLPHLDTGTGDSVSPLRSAGSALASKAEASGSGEAWPAELSSREVGLGEAAPAYWIDSDDSVELAAAEIETIAQMVAASEGVPLNEMLKAAGGLCSASARCALETAALDLLARSRGVALAELLARLPAGGGAACAFDVPTDAFAPDDVAPAFGGGAVGATGASGSAVPAGNDPARASATDSGTSDAGSTSNADRARRMGSDKLRGCAPPVAQSVEVAALCCSASASALSSEVAELARCGFRTFKLKVGSRALDEELARVDAACRALPAGARLRLDANRAWSFDEARRFLSAAACDAIEYVEEPLSSPTGEDLAALASAVGLPIALDESVRSPADLGRLARAGGVAVVVIKLARVGGPAAAVELADAARRLGVGAVVTDSIESRIGRAAAAHTAAAIAARAERSERDGPAAPAVGLGGAMLLAGEPGDLRAEPARPHWGVRGPGLLP
ncbi:MAG: o-succinylbenzoate synthase [Deltaproteobacteria bacterium]|nr:MAG: o-succinylbenzoate synthase [Deltaproteobacteria bacterium]